MAHDFETVDDASQGMLNNVNGDEFQAFNGDNYGQSNIADTSRPNVTGFGSFQTPPTSLWTHSSFPGPSNTHVDSQAQVPRYLGYGGTDPATFNIGSDDTLAYDVFGNGNPMTSNMFEMPTIMTNENFLLDNGHTFGTFDPASESARSNHAIPACSITQDTEQGALKKRKKSVIQNVTEPASNFRVFSGTEVLKLLFKYIRDLSETQMGQIAEDTGYSIEYVFHSLLQYRRAAKSSVALGGNTSSMAHSEFSSMAQSSSIQGPPANGKRTEDSAVGYNTSKDMRQRNGRGDTVSESLQNSNPERWFHCTDCNKKFSRQGELNRHSKKHRPGEYQCTFPDCGKVFYRKDKLRQHWEKEHADIPLPSDLRSSRPGKDHDQDGNPRSNGSSRSGGLGPDRQSSDQSSSGRKSDASGSARDGCASDGLSGYTRHADVDSEIDVDDESDIDNGFDMGSEIDVDNEDDRSLSRSTRWSEESFRPAVSQDSPGVQPDYMKSADDQEGGHIEVDFPNTISKGDTAISSSGNCVEHSSSPPGIHPGTIPWLAAPDTPGTLSRRSSMRSSASSALIDKANSDDGLATISARSNKAIIIDERLGTMSIRARNVVLPCLLREITGCSVSFRQSEREHWISHSASHYGVASPPSHSRCIFCNAVFDSNYSLTPWSDRMEHIADHIENGWLLERSRPDIVVLEDMRKKGCISKQELEQYMRHSRKPTADDPRPYDFIPGKIVEKERKEEERTNRVIVTESREEARERKRGKRPAFVRSKKPKSSPIVLTQP
jgi:hypothetical protein